MGDIRFCCQVCGQKLAIDSAAAGWEIRCPQCGASQIALSAQAPPAAPPQAPRPAREVQPAVPEFAARAPAETDEFEYEAFISYRHVEPDRALAKWLHTALETYRVPARLMAAHGLPARLKKVFRDEEELPASADLSSEIERALRKSRFLIVICSPRTPSSRWVNAEVALFREWGRHDQILAVLIEGEPRKSFPQALREIRRTIVDREGTARQAIEEVEPLAADVRAGAKHGQGQARSLAKLRILASVLGVPFDQLRQRERERERSRNLRLGALVAAGVLCFGGILAALLGQRQLLSYHQRLREDDAEVARKRAIQEAQSVRPPPFDEAQLGKIRNDPYSHVGVRGLLKATYRGLLPASVMIESPIDLNSPMPPPHPHQQPVAPRVRDSERVLVRLTVSGRARDPITMVAALDQAIAREFADYTIGAAVEADATIRGMSQLTEGQVWPERKTYQERVAEYELARQIRSSVMGGGVRIRMDPPKAAVYINCRWIQVAGKPETLVVAEGPRRQDMARPAGSGQTSSKTNLNSPRRPSATR